MLNYLTEEEKHIIRDKGTEAPYTNQYDHHFVDGVYICKQCNQPLFSSKSKFDSGCGWPSFDENYPDAIKRQRDADGNRTEILCSNCGGHLGHVFEGENLTAKNTRHCVNSLSIKFIPQKAKSNVETIYFGGGCFWCTEAVFQKLEGVVSVTSGYSGGNVPNPTDYQIYNTNTGHAEVIKIEYDNSKITLDTLLYVFFATHDPTTLNQQGYDVGEQYRSIVFYTTLDQKNTIEQHIKTIKSEKPVVTKIEPFVNFYQAEDHHKNYYENNPSRRYCQIIIDPKIQKLKKLNVPLKMHG